MKAREHALKVMQRIIALKAELRALENELDHILPDKEIASVTQASAPNGVVSKPHQESLYATTTDSDGTTANLLDRVLRLFVANPAVSFSAEEVCNRLNLPAEQKHSVRSTLWNLNQKGRIRKIRRGEFGALMGVSKSDGSDRAS